MLRAGGDGDDNNDGGDNDCVDHHENGGGDDDYGDITDDMVMIMMMMMEVGRSNLESGGMIFANPRVSQNHALLCQMSNLTEVINKMKFSREGDVLCWIDTIRSNLIAFDFESFEVNKNISRTNKMNLLLCCNDMNFWTPKGGVQKIKMEI